MNKKAELTMQAVFYIMMSVIMIAIIVFGFQRLVMVEDHLSEQERIEFKADLEKALEACEDPLNKGNVRYFDIDSKLINGVCILGDTPLSLSDYGPNLMDELEVFDGTDKNVILISTGVFEDDNGYMGYTDNNFQVIDSFGLDTISGESYCNWGKTFEITC